MTEVSFFLLITIPPGYLSSPDCPEPASGFRLKWPWTGIAGDCNAAALPMACARQRQNFPKGFQTMVSEVSFPKLEGRGKHATRSPEHLFRDSRLMLVVTSRIALQFRNCQRSGCGSGIQAKSKRPTD